MPAVDPNTILSAGQLKDVNRGLAAIDAAIQKCDLAEGCQVDCTDRRDALEGLRQQFNQIKATYFPGSK